MESSHVNVWVFSLELIEVSWSKFVSYQPKVLQVGQLYLTVDDNVYTLAIDIIHIEPNRSQIRETSLVFNKVFYSLRRNLVLSQAKTFQTRENFADTLGKVKDTLISNFVFL